MKNEVELTLLVLECFLKYGPLLSIEDLRIKIKTSEKKIKSILSVLEKRGYLAETKDAGKYMLSKKIAMLI
ncbi:MAG: hypothetical protein Q8O13_10750 [Candidatus Omnitrophota bacterium]|nr:hypothetical protein [Candidatus Omnitrophota bacterium]